MFDACDFLAELTQHIPPKGVHLIRRYGLYSSRTKGAWESMPYVAERAPAGCPKCGSEMKVIAIIQESLEIERILRHPVKQGPPPPGFDPASLN